MVMRAGRGPPGPPQALDDTAAIAARASALLASVGRPPLNPDTVAIFCRNAWDLRVVSTRSLAEEVASPLIDGDMVYSSGREELFSQSPLLWAVTLKAAEAFHLAHGRWPGAPSAAAAAGGVGAGEDEVERLAADGAAVWAFAQGLCGGGEVPCLTEDYAHEVARYGCAQVRQKSTDCFSVGIAVFRGGCNAREARRLFFPAFVLLLLSEWMVLFVVSCETFLTRKYLVAVLQELHSISAFMGGMAAQEAVKIITHLWVPANNTIVYNGIAGTVLTMEL